MASFDSRRVSGSTPLGRGIRQILLFLAGLLMSSGWPPRVEAQQQPQGFAVERFYPAAPGSGWFVMDDLNMSGGFGGAIALTSGYSRKPLDVTGPDGSQHLSLVSDATIMDVGVAGTYDRYRVYFNFPMPVLVSGTSGALGPYELSAPAVSPGMNPDTISDPRVGFDIRVLGKPGNWLRLGVGAQLIFPSGERAEYVTDGTYRGMFRFLAAGDTPRFSYAGHLGVHVRPLDDSPAPGSPNGSELLFGVSAGRKLSVRSRWTAVVGPEVYGETAFRAFLNEQKTGVEGLLTGRLERTGNGPRLRLKLGVGHGLVQHFGAPEWRVLFSVELFGQGSRPGNSP
jgi:hypothetical protein